MSRPRTRLLILFASLVSCGYDFDAPFDETRSRSDAGTDGADVFVSDAPDDSPMDSDVVDASHAMDVFDADDSEDANNDVDAAVVSPIDRVQSGSAVLGTNAAVVDVAISSVDPDRSILLFSAAYNNATPSTAAITGQLVSSESIRFEREGNGNAASIGWYVASFASGVQVQRGTLSLMSSQNVPLTLPADPAKSFPIISVRKAGGAFGSNDLVTARLTGSNTLRLDGVVNVEPPEVVWQVVSFDAAMVQSGGAAFTDGTSLVEESIQPVSQASTWLLATHRAGVFFGVPEEPSRDLLVRGLVSATDRVRFLREGDNGAVEAAWCTVSFDNGTEVRTGTANLTVGQATASVPLVGLDMSRSVATTAGLFGRSGTTDYPSADTGESSVTLELGSAGLVMTRESSASTATIDWSVVTFR